MWFSISVLTGLLATMAAAAGPRPSLVLSTDYWAFLVCGSNNYTNYRHQANTAHSYHTMLNLGVPPERIVLMMFDDVAFNRENPRPGVLINSLNGPNVYEGIKIDYKGWDVTPDNFLKILSGNKTAMKGIGTGRVIESNSNSTVFVYFVDHGGPGVLFFPDWVPLGADDLHNTLTIMHQKKQYNKMIIFVEACYTGSLFEELVSENKNVLVFSASARDEGSWPWYCESNNMTSCKGDEFSVSLWEYMDSAKKGEYRTVFDMYQRVRTGVSHSHVMLYGDFSVGAYSFIPNKLGRAPVKMAGRELETSHQISIKPMDAHIFHLEQKVAHSKSLQTRLAAQKDLDDLKSGRARFDEMMAHLVTVATADAPDLRDKVISEHLSITLDMFPCYKQLLESFRKFCFVIQSCTGGDCFLCKGIIIRPLREYDGLMMSLHQKRSPPVLDLLVTIDSPDDYVISQLNKLSNLCVLRINTSKLLREMPRICKPYF